ncbi:DNA-3-methyladenine glycosylase [soil metagenome]
MKKLHVSFYDRDDVVLIAKELIGKIVVTNIDGIITSGRIVETEAYVAHVDKASHAYGGKRTNRNEHMYAQPGSAYIYICYGMHQMLNVVTNKKDIPDAVLIRGIEPIEGIEIMLLRTGKNVPDPGLTRGPGNVGKALGIDKSHSGSMLTDNQIFLVNDGKVINENEIGISGRIGVASAENDALLPYRFYIKNNKHVSGFRK